MAGASARREYERRRDLDRGRLRQDRRSSGGVPSRGGTAGIDPLGIDPVGTTDEPATGHDAV